MRETFRTGGKILTDISGNRSHELSPKYIMSKYVTLSVQNLIDNLRAGSRKRARVVTPVTKKRKKAKRARVIKGTSPDLLQSLVIMRGADVAAVRNEFDIFAGDCVDRV